MEGGFRHSLSPLATVRGTNCFNYFSFSVRKLPLDCFGTSFLAMAIQLDRRPLVAGANGGGIKAPSKPFSKLLQNSRVLLQAFPNKCLVVW